MAFLHGCAVALRAAPSGAVALYLGGRALLGDALCTAGRIAAHLSASLLCEPLPARVDRGAGYPHLESPVAAFGYKDGPSELIQLPDEAVWEFDAAWSVLEALQLLEQLLPGAAAVAPGVNCRGKFPMAARPQLPSGRLTAAAVCQVVAALQPANCILIDESLTSGSTYWDASKKLLTLNYDGMNLKDVAASAAISPCPEVVHIEARFLGCPRFSHLCLTGGAIGSGPPLAVGAAVAVPDRQVINLQADGSAMYSLQVEAMRQRSGSMAMTSLSEPELDWVALAAGMGVGGGRARTAEQRYHQQEMVGSRLLKEEVELTGAELPQDLSDVQLEQWYALHMLEM
eukprot:gene10637-10795_t